MQLSNSVFEIFVCVHGVVRVVRVVTLDVWRIYVLISLFGHTIFVPGRDECQLGIGQTNLISRSGTGVSSVFQIIYLPVLEVVSVHI